MAEVIPTSPDLSHAYAKVNHALTGVGSPLIPRGDSEDDLHIYMLENLAAQIPVFFAGGSGGGASESITITGANSIAGGGDLTINRTLQLINDSASPGNSKYYGTSSGGTKGYQDLTAAINAGVTASSTVTGKANATTTITGVNSVSGGGDLSANRTFSLVNDTASPGNSKVYGTTSGGVLGWQNAVQGPIEVSGVDDQTARLLIPISANSQIAYQFDNGSSYFLAANADPTVNGNWNLLSSGGGVVSSFNTRVGAVVPTAGDYTGALVTNTPAGAIVATTVQAAINELDADKVAATRAVIANNTVGSVVGGGDLTADRTITLQGDQVSPGNSKYYGTSSGGTKGYFDVPGQTDSLPVTFLGTLVAASDYPVGQGFFRAFTIGQVRFKTGQGTCNVDVLVNGVVVSTLAATTAPATVTLTEAVTAGQTLVLQFRDLSGGAKDFSSTFEILY